MTVAERPVAARISLLEWLTVERAAYGGLLLFAGLWRALQLGLFPLTRDEVRQALTAWDAAQGHAVTLWGLSPLLFTLQEATFFLAQAGDAMARLWPLIAGLAICLIPYLLRRQIGRDVALLTAAFLALSPTLTYFARQGTGDVMAAAAALAAWALILAASEDARRVSWAAVALALGLISGPGIYTALLAWGLASVLWAREEVAARWREWQDRGQIRRAAMIGGLVFLLGATSGLRHWDGVGAAAGLLGQWAERWARPETGYPFYWPWLRVLLDEPLLLAFGIYGAVLGIRRGDRLTKVLALWAGLALIWPTLTPGRRPEDLVMAIPPLAILAGQGGIAYWKRLHLRHVRAEAGLVIAILGALSVTLYVWISGYSYWGTREYVAAMLAPLGLMVGLVLFFGFWAGWRTTGQALVLFLAALGLLWTLSVGWINAHGMDMDRRPAVRFERTSTEVRWLASYLERLSAQRVGDPHLLPVEVMDSPWAPMLRWYLRRMAYVTVIGAPLRGETAPVVITPMMEELAPGEAYSGQDFLIAERWSPAGLRGHNLVRWLLLRQGKTPAEEERAIVWVMREEMSEE
ncbi:MAG TPA: hypothetical protein G4O02_01575 [Caldilineae bacterium]|nr:hypothetical protein [Caldilineae bacterium]